MTGGEAAWEVGHAVLLGSREHYGWPETEYAVAGVHPGRSVKTEFLQVRRRDGDDRSLYLRRRFGELEWATSPAEELPVAAWWSEQLADGAPFTPPEANPDSWLYVRPPS